MEKMITTPRNVNENNPEDEHQIHAVAVYSGAHPAHQRMLNDCCADSIKMLGEWSVDRSPSARDKLSSYLGTAWRLRHSDYDVVVVEGTIPSALMAPLINGLSRHPKAIIALCGEDALYRAFIEGDKSSRAILRYGFRFISGIITSGDIVPVLARKYLKPLPVEVRYPQVAPERLGTLSTLEPSIDSHAMVLIGGGSPYCKGVDIAVDTLAILRKQFPDARLTILGFPDLKEEPGVSSPGPVADIAPYLCSASILIHPGRGEAFGIVAVEAMLAGVVPFVSEWTGALSIVQEGDPKLVVPLKAEEFAKRIADLWSAPAEQRQSLSKKCKRVARAFTVKTAAQPSLAPFIERIAQTKKSRG